jgi:hypothetical protein
VRYNMGGVIGSFLGGKPKPATTVKEAPTGFETLPGFAQEAFQTTIGRGQEFLGRPELFAPAQLTEQQQMALQTLASGLAPLTPETFQTGLRTFQDPFEEQVVQGAIRDIREGTLGELSDIGARAGQFGAFGGQRQALLESDALRRMGQQIGDVSGRLRSLGFQQAAEKTLGDIARQRQTAATLFPLAETQRGIQQQAIQAPLRQTEFLQNLLLGIPTGGGTQRVTETAAPPSQAEQVGQALQIAASAAALFSDKRLKKDIVYVGKKNGYKLYDFVYKFAPSIKYRGVMAQDILKIKPEAIKSLFGFLAVDYNKLGLTMERV